MFPSINRQLAPSLQKSDSPAHHKALGTSVSEIRRDAFARAGWERSWSKSWSRTSRKTTSKRTIATTLTSSCKAEEWVDYNMSGAYLESDAPVIVVSGESR